MREFRGDGAMVKREGGGMVLGGEEGCLSERAGRGARNLGKLQAAEGAERRDGMDDDVVI